MGYTMCLRYNCPVPSQRIPWLGTRSIVICFVEEFVGWFQKRRLPWRELRSTPSRPLQSWEPIRPIFVPGHICSPGDKYGPFFVTSEQLWDPPCKSAVRARTGPSSGCMNGRKMGILESRSGPSEEPVESVDVAVQPLRRSALI